MAEHLFKTNPKADERFTQELKAVKEPVKPKPKL